MEDVDTTETEFGDDSIEETTSNIAETTTNIVTNLKLKSHSDESDPPKFTSSGSAINLLSEDGIHEELDYEEELEPEAEPDFKEPESEGECGDSDEEEFVEEPKKGISPITHITHEKFFRKEEIFEGEERVEKIEFGISEEVEDEVEDGEDGEIGSDDGEIIDGDDCEEGELRDPEEPLSEEVEIVYGGDLKETSYLLTTV
jgi:hypothetical protein